jgi:hypothetical protein
MECLAVHAHFECCQRENHRLVQLHRACAGGARNSDSGRVHCVISAKCIAI